MIPPFATLHRLRPSKKRAKKPRASTRPAGYTCLHVESLESRILLAAVPFSAQNVIIDGEFTSREPHAVFSVDLDGDGDADVLSATFGDDKIAWYENRLNEASADFAPQETITTSASGAESVFAADLDGDGDGDILSASRDDDKIAWYENRLNEAAGDIGPQQVINIADPDSNPFNPTNGNAREASSVFAADLDGDGDMDVLSASDNDDKIAWYENRLNEPSADFGAQQIITTSANGARSVFAIDLDGDGDADVLSASQWDNKIAWYENRLNEPSADFGSQETITTSTVRARSVFAVDLDGDGDADVLSASRDDDKIAWYENRLNEPSADFGSQVTITASADVARSVFAIDLDGDGDADVLSASLGDDTVAWYENRLNEPSADFGPQETITVSADSAYSVFAVDLDGDGDADVLSASKSDDKIAWYENRLNEATTDFGSQVTISSAASADSARSVFAVDLDGDSDADVLSASFHDDRIAWYENRLNEATADFGPQHTITNNVNRAGSVFAIDLDGDGDADVLSASDYDDKVAWYENRLNEAAADFGPQQTVATTSGAHSVFAVDLDGDGDADVISAWYDSNTIAWYENRLNEASADFETHGIHPDFTLYGGGYSLIAVDLDGDGDADVVSASDYTDDISPGDVKVAWYENRLNEASGDFGQQRSIDNSNYAAHSVFAADLDGDGDADVVSTLSSIYFDEGIVWYENRLNEVTVDFGPKETISSGDIAYDNASVFAVDLDGDGDADPLSASPFRDEIAWFENRLNEASADFGQLQSITTNADGAHSVFAADLDGDGDTDVLSASYYDDKIAWYENLNKPLLPPQVVAVEVSGDGWSQRVTVPDGSTQLDPLPLADIDQIHLTFSEHVTVVQGDLELFGVNVLQYGFVSPGSGGFSYDAQTVTATWKLTAPIATDKLRLILSETVLDIDGNALDGNWTDTLSAFPSGDTVAGGDFAFRFNVLPGDIRQDGKVDALDMNVVSTHFQVANADPQQGDASGDRVVDLTDVDIVSTYFGSLLPEGEPGSGSASGNTTGTGGSSSASSDALPAEEPVATIPQVHTALATAGTFHADGPFVSDACIAPILAQIGHAPDDEPAFDASPAWLAQPPASPIPVSSGRDARESLFATLGELLRPTDIAQKAADSLLGSHTARSSWTRSTDHVPYRQELEEVFHEQEEEWRFLRALVRPRVR